MKKGKGILIAVLCVLIASMVGVMIWMITLGGTGAREFWKNFSFLPETLSWSMNRS